MDVEPDPAGLDRKVSAAVPVPSVAVVRHGNPTTVIAMRPLDVAMMIVIVMVMPALYHARMVVLLAVMARLCIG